MNGIPGDLFGRVQAALLHCGPFDSDRTLRSLFVDARLSAWRDLLPEASSRVERARAIIDTLSERANPNGENALVLLLHVIAENTPPGDACREQLVALAAEVAANRVRMGNKIRITDDGDIIGEHNAIIKDLVATRGINVVFIGDYERLGRTYLDPWPVFEKADLDCFERRHWLEEQIDAFLQQNSHGYFIIEAEAGVGKTAFAAELVRRFGFVHHFVELAPGQSGIVTGLMNLTAQLVRAYLSTDEITNILETTQSQFPTSRDDDFSRPVLPNTAAYANYLLDLLNKVVTKGSGEAIILVIDGLDIAGTPPGQNALGLPSVLPEGVFLIVTHRPVPVSLNIHPKTPRHKVRLAADDKDNDNLDDMRRYLKNVASRPAIRATLARCHCTEDWFIEAVIEKCAGVWLYAQYIIYEIEDGRRDPLDLTSLPDGLPQYYANYWGKWRHSNDWDKIYCPVLGMLAATRKPICTADLLSWTGVRMRKESLHRLLSEKWRDFVVPLAGHCYKFAHMPLYDFCEGMVEEQSLFDDSQRNLLEELKQATMKYAWQIIHKAQDIEMRRDAALTLAKMHWFDSCEANVAQVDDVLTYLDVVGRFLTAASERENIVKGLSSILDLPGLPAHSEIQLRVHRAINYGYLNQFDEAASDYREAWRLIRTKELVVTDLLTAARILLGGGNIAREKGSRINPQKDQPARTRLLTQARNTYLRAAKLAEDYGQDAVLIIVIYKELSWCEALLSNWSAAERSYHKALGTLVHIEDAQTSTSYKARVLEKASVIHWEKGQYMLGVQKDTTQALNAYQTAYDFARDELNMLEGTLGEIEALTIAHINAGDYELAISELPNCSDPQCFGQKARDHWNTALELAQAWGLPDLEQEAQSRLQ